MNLDNLTEDEKNDLLNQVVENYFNRYATGKGNTELEAYFPFYSSMEFDHDNAQEKLNDYFRFFENLQKITPKKFIPQSHSVLKNYDAFKEDVEAFYTRGSSPRQFPLSVLIDKAQNSEEEKRILEEVEKRKSKSALQMPVVELKAELGLYSISNRFDKLTDEQKNTLFNNLIESEIHGKPYDPLLPKQQVVSAHDGELAGLRSEVSWLETIKRIIPKEFKAAPNVTSQDYQKFIEKMELKESAALNRFAWVRLNPLEGTAIDSQKVGKKLAKEAALKRDSILKKAGIDLGDVSQFKGNGGKQITEAARQVLEGGVYAFSKLPVKTSRPETQGNKSDLTQQKVFEALESALTHGKQAYKHLEDDNKEVYDFLRQLPGVDKAFTNETIQDLHAVLSEYNQTFPNRENLSSDEQTALLGACLYNGVNDIGTQQDERITLPLNEQYAIYKKVFPNMTEAFPPYSRESEKEKQKESVEPVFVAGEKNVMMFDSQEEADSYREQTSNPSSLWSRVKDLYSRAKDFLVGESSAADKKGKRNHLQPDYSHPKTKIKNMLQEHSVSQRQSVHFEDLQSQHQMLVGKQKQLDTLKKKYAPKEVQSGKPQQLGHINRGR